MNITEWLKEAKDKLDKEELGHCEVEKGRIQLQVKNCYSGEIEVHEFEYIAKGAVNLKIQGGI